MLLVYVLTDFVDRTVDGIFQTFLKNHKEWKYSQMLIKQSLDRDLAKNKDAPQEGLKQQELEAVQESDYSLQDSK